MIPLPRLRTLALPCAGQANLTLADSPPAGTPVAACARPAAAARSAGIICNYPILYLSTITASSRDSANGF